MHADQQFARVQRHPLFAKFVAFEAAALSSRMPIGDAIREAVLRSLEALAVAPKAP